QVLPLPSGYAPPRCRWPHGLLQLHLPHPGLHHSLLWPRLRLVRKGRTRGPVRHRPRHLDLPTPPLPALASLFLLWPPRVALALPHLPAVGALPPPRHPLAPRPLWSVAACRRFYGCQLRTSVSAYFRFRVSAPPCGASGRVVEESLFSLSSYLCALCVLSSVTGACPDPVGVLPSLFPSSFAFLFSET